MGPRRDVNDRLIEPHSARPVSVVRTACGPVSENWSALVATWNTYVWYWLAVPVAPVASRSSVITTIVP
jgi:hypothetical protein